MDSQTRYSAGDVVASTSISDAVAVFEAQWVSQFWPPTAVQMDQAFNNIEFTEYLTQHDITPRYVPPRRHSKNVLESKHRTLRDIYLRLKDADPDASERLRVAQMFRISNDLYGNDVASSNELAKGYTRPIADTGLHPLPQEIQDAHQELIAKRKLNAILRSHAVTEPSIKVGDVVQIFVHHEHQKRGTWSEAQPVLKYDPKSRTVTVAGSKGRYRKAAVEDVRHAIDNIDLAVEIQNAIDVLTHEIEGTVDDMIPDDDILDDTPASNLDDSSNADFEETGSTSAMDIEAMTYHPPADPLSTQHETIQPVEANTQPTIPTLPAPSTHTMTLRSTQPTTQGNEIELRPGTELTSIEGQVLRDYESRFGSKEFMHEASGLPSFITENSYLAEEEIFLKTCVKVPIPRVPSDANVIASHVLYKIKERDDGTKFCKGRIAPHGNEDRDKYMLKTDSAACSPVGMRVLLCIYTIFSWYLTKIDVKSAFLQTGSAEGDVFVIPPRESSRRGFYWLLTAASYGLVNANAKWQRHSDTTFLDLGLKTMVYIPQLFYKFHDSCLVLIVAKIVDDILVGGEDSFKNAFLRQLGSRYKLGTIVHLPGSFLYYGLRISQSEEFEIQVSADDKLNGIMPHAVSKPRSKQADDTLNALELHHFNSVNCS